jgi:hypothetical protein
MSGFDGRQAQRRRGALIAEAARAEDLAALVRLPSLTACVRSNSAGIVRDFASLYSTGLLVAGSDGHEAALSFVVEESRRNGDGASYRLREASHGLGSFESAHDAVAYLEHWVNTAAVASSFDRYVLVHAGVVSSGGAGVLIPGASGAGKSTLVAALCLEGFSYLSDELAVVDAESLSVLPFLKAICLKAGGWSALGAAFPVPAPLLTAFRIDGEKLFFLEPPLPSPSDRHTKVQYVIVPVRRPGAPPDLAPCSRAVALAELARQSLNLPRHGGSGVEVLARVVEEAECFLLTYDDLGGAVAAIATLSGHW